MKVLRLLIVLLSLAGVVDSWLALRVHYSTETQVCDINEHWDCGIVNHSSYAEIQHVPVAILGIVGYLALAALAWLRRERLLTLASIPGLGFALYLTHIEKDVLMVYCLYCVISQVLIVLILLMALGWAVWNWKNRQSSRA
jgi:vitamin-K-epoxide reductase (warfarin-sensitive)